MSPPADSPLGLTPHEQRMMKGGDGQYVICHRYRSELGGRLNPWAIRPVVAVDDPDEARAVLSNMDDEFAGGVVLGLLDTASDSWLVYPKPRPFRRRLKRLFGRN